MSDIFVPRFFGYQTKISLAFLLLAGLCGAVAAQEAAPQNSEKPAAQNPFRALTDAMGLTTETGQAADFVRATHPDEEKMDYSRLTGVDKKRAPVKTPAEVEADKAALVAVRGQADERRKKLEGEKLAPVAPNKAPPPTDDKF